ncbi:MAG TPA: TRAP transporter substrate-binding protein DctP [Burkholderiales bacterium]|nr:TRAP transporter substrate-binding protein DctP [Burkholderiales bacterium]
MTARLCTGLAAGAVALLAVQGAFAQTVDGPKVDWKVATWGKPRAFTSGIEKIRDYVKEKTGGKFNITIGYSTFGGEREILDILSAGGLQATTICSSYHPDKHPAYTGLDLPFLPLPSFDVQWAVHDAYHKHPYIVKEMEKWNAMLYSSNLLPQYEFIGKGKAPKKLDDFKGMRVRAIGGIGAAMKNLGAVPTSVPATEVYTSIDRGTVDAASFPSTYAHGSYKIHEVGSWFTTNLAPGTQACPTLINKDAWAKLPQQYRKLVEEVRPQVKEALMKAYKAADDKNLPLFKKRLEFVTYTEAELDEFRRVGAKPVWDAWIQEMSAKGIPAKELFELIMTSAKQAAKK